MPSQAPQTVYAKCIMAKVPSRGYPLYIPGPNPHFPDQYQRGGLHMGDVGYISAAGNFEFLFNLCLPRDHPFNKINGVPDGFSDIPLMVLEEHGYKDVTVDMEADRRGQVISTCDATQIELTAQAGAAVPGGEVGAGFGVRFSTSESEGGILVLPHGSWSFDIQNGLGRLYRELVRNWQSWYHFANSKLDRMTRKPLLLVTGFHKASDWCLASYSHDAGGAAISFVLRVGHLAGADVSASHSWQSAGTVISKVGPIHGYEEGKQNQTIFVRGISIAPRGAIIAAVTPSWCHGKITALGTLPSAGTELIRKAPPHPTLSSRMSKLLGRSRVHEGDRDGGQGGTGSGGYSGGQGGQGSGGHGGGTSGIGHGGSNPSSGRGGSNPGSGDADHDNEEMIHGHPSNIINKYLLSLFPEADVAITHDDSWMDAFEGKINDDELIRRVCKEFEPAYDEDEHIAYLQPK